jgi:ribosome biogenesis protein ENP2
VEGRFYAPLAARSPGINACALAPAHGLFAAAGEEGLLECFDLRQRACAGCLDVAEACGTVRRRALRHQPSSIASV